MTHEAKLDRRLSRRTNIAVGIVLILGVGITWLTHSAFVADWEIPIVQWIYEQWGIKISAMWAFNVLQLSYTVMFVVILKVLFKARPYRPTRVVHGHTWA